MIVMIFVTALFWSCGGGGQNKAQREQLQEAKNQTIQNINRYKNEIEERIDYVDGQIEEATGELKNELEDARATLKEQQKILVTELKNVEDASLETWNDIVAGASESLGKARSKMNEVSKNVRELLEDE